MTSLGAPIPDKAVSSRTGHGIDLVIKPGSNHPLLRGQADAMGYECWNTCPDGLQVLMVERETERAGVLIADQVQSQGTVVYAKTVDGWTTERHENVRPLIDNVLLRAFGPPPAPGQTHPIFDPYKPRTPAANTTHLAGVHKMLWDVPDARYRKVFLVSEPIGMARKTAYVEVQWKTPSGADMGIVRSFTAGGIELYTQQIANDRFAIAMPLRAYDDQLIAIYIGGQMPTNLRQMRYSGGPEIKSTPHGWQLRNDHFEALLGLERPQLWLMRPLGGSSNNIFQSWGNPSHWLGNGTDFAIRTKRRAGPIASNARVVLDGPVRKTIRYTTQFEEHDLVSEISLVRGSPVLFYRVSSSTPHSVALETGWSPGDSMANDSLWYEAVDGLKQLPLVFDPATDYTLDKHAKETWYAIADSETNEVGGGFRERDNANQFDLRLYSHHIHGQLAVLHLHARRDNRGLGRRSRRGACGPKRLHCLA